MIASLLDALRYQVYHICEASATMLQRLFNNTIILLPNKQSNQMNILAYQEILSVEMQLLTADILHKHSLLLPNPQQLQTLSDQQQMLQTLAIQNELINKKIKIKECFRIEQLKDGNSIMRMVIYNLFVCVFTPSDKRVTQQKPPKYNLQLLNTIKCTLYCKDIKPKSLKNSRITFDDHETQALIAHFLKNIQQYHETSRSNRNTLKYCEWMLKNNRVIEDILIAMLRYILSKLQIQGAQDCNQAIDIKDAIINIIQYFDLTYRTYQQVILYHQEKVLLALSSNNLILGTYSEGQTQLGIQNKGKDRLWEGSGLVQSVNGGEGLTKTQQLKRKTAVVQNDVKLFNCLLKSSRSQQQIKNSLKDYEGQTPHFKDSKEINFGRKIKDQSEIQKKRQIKNEFARLILGSSHKNLAIQESEIKEVDSHKSPSNSKNGSKGRCINLSAKNSSDNQKINDKTRAHELNTRKNKFNLSNKRSSQGSSIGSQIKYKNRVSVKDQSDRPRTPKAQPQKKPRFGSLGNDFQFIFPQFTQNKENNIQKKQQSFQPYQKQCPCFRHKLQRNYLASNTVNYTFTPVMKNTTNMPFYNNHRKSPGAEAPKIVVTSPQKYKQYYFRGDRLPTFLKAKIQKNQQSQQKKTLKTSQKMKTIQRTPENKKHIFKHLSQILPNRPGDRSISIERRSGNKKIVEVSSIKKYDFHQFRSKEREGLGNPQHHWKSTSIMYHHAPKKQEYRRTMEQPNNAHPIEDITSTLRDHSQQKRRNKYSTDQIGCYEERNYMKVYENTVGYKRLVANKSEKVIPYRRYDNM